MVEVSVIQPENQNTATVQYKREGTGGKSIIGRVQGSFLREDKTERKREIFFHF